MIILTMGTGALCALMNDRSVARGPETTTAARHFGGGRGLQAVPGGRSSPADRRQASFPNSSASD